MLGKGPCSGSRRTSRRASASIAAPVRSDCARRHSRALKVGDSGCVTTHISTQPASGKLQSLDPR